VPLLSYLLLRGRCRKCGSRIGWQYPVVELVTAALIAGSVLKFGLSGRAVVAGFFCAVLVAISAIDIAHRIVPNRIVLPAATLVLAAQTALQPSLEWALASLGGALFLFVAVLAYPKGMGMGDVKLMLLVGAAVGRTVPVALMVAMLAALVPAVVLFARHGSAARKHAIPFAPFLALGGIVALFTGAELLDAYRSML
jgi:leader peptidase (prepilin peptidase) / N-methyltransferase